MVKKWVYRELPAEETVHRLAQQINVNQVVASILVQRSVLDYQQAKDFFRPSLDQLHHPFLMKDMDRAVDRLLLAIDKKEQILIYGDYDVDGTTAVALCYGFLKQHYRNLDYYIPDRYQEGYGLSQRAIDLAHQKEVSLIITLDCGIKATQLISQAKERGIDFIICDHHRPGMTLPPAVAVLDPKREDCNYPFDELSGCGVGFKFLQGFCERASIPVASLYEYLDLVAVSVASDMVPITGENRVLTHFGLRKLNHSPGPGLKSLRNLAGIRRAMTVSDVVFGIAPRINAAGRIDHAKDAVKLLLSEDEKEADHWAGQVNEKNITRRSVDANITEEALAMIEQRDPEQQAKSTVLYKEDWHKGVIGIVASRCLEKYYRPTIILTESKHKATGSARSVAGFDIYQAITECSDLLDQYGGHKYAAGLTLPLDKVTDFQERFEEVVSKSINEELLTPVIDVDQTISFDQIDFRLHKLIKQMAPFGPENRQPVFVTKNVKTSHAPRILKEAHLKFFIKEESSAIQFDAIGFGLSHYAEAIKDGALFDVAYSIDQNDYQGHRSLQLIVKDIRLN